MTLNEIWAMSYDEYVHYLLNKYGGAKYDYFYSPECRSKNHNNVRTKEGLECHHIDEDKYPLLSSRRNALEFPFECQRADRLVYADKIEHLILHIKICEDSANGSKYSLGTSMLVGSINSMFESPPTTGYRLNMYDKIKDNFELYLEVLHRLADEMYNRNDIFLLDKGSYVLNNQVDIKLLHQLANDMKIEFPLVRDMPKDVKTMRHWTLLRLFILRKGTKNDKFPISVAKAFAKHENKDDYEYIDASNKQISLDDLI